MSLNVSRHRLWQSRLDELVRSRRNAPFVWGENDCALFAADCVIAVCDIDPAAILRGTYADQSSAAELVTAMGGLHGIASGSLGDECDVVMARPGDIGLVAHSEGETLCVCLGSFWMAPGPSGLVRFRSEHVSHAWRVGP